jgi:hypothetical protein
VGIKVEATYLIGQTGVAVAKSATKSDWSDRSCLA